MYSSVLLNHAIGTSCEPSIKVISIMKNTAHHQNWTLLKVIFSICMATTLLLWFACHPKGDTKKSTPPNIVFLLVDDLGWNDIACYGSTFHETPNIDRLAKEGMRFTNAYAACPVCKLKGIPITDAPDFLEERDARSKQKQDNPVYAAMVQSVDESVGNILQQLEDFDLIENTIIVFTSDNGGFTTLSPKRTAPTAVAPLRAGKGWLYEGGIRVPAIVKWAGKVPSNTSCDEPIISTDFYPTLLSMAGLPSFPTQHIDGKSMVPLLEQKDDFSRSALYWHFPHYHGSKNRPSAAIRAGDYKLIEWFEDGAVELYNLKTDIGEQNNLAIELPEKKVELQTLLKDWRKEVGALIPRENRDYE